MTRVLGTIFAGLLGLAFGSFLNVCLSRWPGARALSGLALIVGGAGGRSSGGKMCRL